EGSDHDHDDDHDAAGQRKLVTPETAPGLLHRASGNDGGQSLRIVRAGGDGLGSDQGASSLYRHVARSIPAVPEHGNSPGSRVMIVSAPISTVCRDGRSRAAGSEVVHPPNTT